MKYFQELKDLLFLDTETVSTVASYETLSEPMKELWQRKAKQFPDIADPADAFARKAGIFAEFGKIITIAIGYFYLNEEKQLSLRIKSIARDDEAQLLTEFSDLLDKKFSHRTRLVAHNGKEFDYPYICRRMLVHGIRLPRILNLTGKKAWDIPHLDTMDMWRFGDRKNYTSLKLLAALFNISPCKEGMEGSQVTDIYYHQQGLDRIANYCEWDVRVTAQVYLRLRNMPPVEQDNIFHV